MSLLTDTIVVTISQVCDILINNEFIILNNKLNFRSSFLLVVGCFLFVNLAEIMVYEIVYVILSFALTFALSCTMFELIIFEILALLQPTYVSFFSNYIEIYILFIYRSRYLHWRIGLYCMLFLLVFLIPFYIAYLLLNTIKIGKIFIF